MKISIIIFIIYILIITSIVWKKDGRKSGILIFLLFGACFLFFFGISFLDDISYSPLNRMEEDIDYLEREVDNNYTFKDKYQVETIHLPDGRLLLKVFNERDEYVNARCFVKFYDNGKEVSVPNTAFISYIAPHSYGYGILYDYINSNDTYKKYQNDEVVVYITPINYSYSVNCENDIDFGYNQEEGIIYGVNKSNLYADNIEFGILYYDNESKIIDYYKRSIYDDIRPNGEFSFKNYNNNGKIDVFLNYALCKKEH